MNNEINLSIKDFQIIKSASMSFIPGLNCIVGQSNNGKTAVFRAAKSCIYNEPGTTSIRHGCNNYVVGIYMNGHKVILQKGSNTLYKVDDTIYQKIGRVQLPEVADALNITELSLNGSNEQINFWDQMEKPFLLDRSETDLFRFIVDTGKDSNVTQASKSLTSDRQSITKEIAVTEGMLQQANATVTDFDNKLVGSDDKLDVCSKVVALNQRLSFYKALSSKVEEYLNIDKELSRIKAYYTKLSAYFEKISSLFDLANTHLMKRDSLENILKTHTNITSSLEELRSKLITQDISADDLTNYYGKYNDLLKNIIKYNRISSQLSLIKPIVIPDISSLTSGVSSYDRLYNLLVESNRLTESIQKASGDISIISEELGVLNKEINEIGICPTCGQLINHTV